MRTATEAQAEALRALDTTTHKQVLIQNADGAWVNVCDLLGHDWLDSVTIEADADNPIGAATIMLRRQIDGYSMSPLVEASEVNRTSAGVYGPLVNAGRGVRVNVSKVLQNQPASEWVFLWEGLIDEVDWGTGPNAVRLYCRDPMARLNDTFIETTAEYGADDGSETLEEVAQRILTANISAPSMTLTAESATGFAVRATNGDGTPYQVGNVTVLEALVALRDLVGFNLHWRHTEGSGFGLTLWEPQRSNTTSVYAFGPDDYFAIPRVGFGLEGIRNKGEVVYTTAAGVVEDVTETRAASVALYGTRFIRIDARGTSVVTATQAADLLDAILDDLEEPAFQQEIDCAFFWPCELGDLYTFLPNDHYDTEQKWAVFGYRHVLSGDRCRTVLSVAGKPSGGYDRWHRKEVADATAPVYANGEIVHLNATVRSHTGDTSTTALQTVEVPALWPTSNSVRARGVFTTTGAGGSKDLYVIYNGSLGLAVTVASGVQTQTIDVTFTALGFESMKGVYALPAGLALPTVLSSPLTNNQALSITFAVDLADAADTASLQLSEVTWLGEST